MSSTVKNSPRESLADVKMAQRTGRVPVQPVVNLVRVELVEAWEYPHRVSDLNQQAADVVNRGREGRVNMLAIQINRKNKPREIRDFPANTRLPINESDSTGVRFEMPVMLDIRSIGDVQMNLAPCGPFALE